MTKRFDIMTLFPELVDAVLGSSIIGRAQRAGYLSVRSFNIRDYLEDKHRRVDDTPYGGGKGMLMAAPPIYACYEGVLRAQAEDGFTGTNHVIYLSPTGKVLTQNYILREIWGLVLASDTSSLRVFMATLRKKIEPCPAKPIYIQTRVGIGYRMTWVERGEESEEES